jgi:hypothetical protein
VLCIFKEYCAEMWEHVEGPHGDVNGGVGVKSHFLVGGLYKTLKIVQYLDLHGVAEGLECECSPSGFHFLKIRNEPCHGHSSRC